MKYQYYYYIILILIGCSIKETVSIEEENETFDCNVDICLQLEFGQNENELFIKLINLKEISGFQFKLNHVLINSFTGGKAIEEGFSVSNSDITYMILGFSLLGEYISIGQGKLLELELLNINDLPICITEPIFVGTENSTPSLSVNTGVCITTN